MVRERIGHSPSYAVAKKLKSLTVHIHGCPRASLRDCSYCYRFMQIIQNHKLFVRGSVAYSCRPRTNSDASYSSMEAEFLMTSTRNASGASSQNLELNAMDTCARYCSYSGTASKLSTSVLEFHVLLCCEMLIPLSVLTVVMFTITSPTAQGKMYSASGCFDGVVACSLA